MSSIEIPAAQYLRMSTELQQYSLVNQAAAIARYAEEHGFRIVKTYTDAGKSGVILRHREGLRQLLSDVTNASGTEFKAVLVYDVSRWGRFQDVDEAAHYEYLCKSAGVPVLYCAEAFSNDPTMPNSIMKVLKRAMAGEYSRELGVKVYAGLKRLAGLGFKQGGHPGFGLRRMLVSAQGKPKQMLLDGERKSTVNDRVVVVPGPSHEVETVREIYRMFISGRYSYDGIACELNRRGIRFSNRSQWSVNTVRLVLIHPKYAGFQVFGRTTQKLHRKVRQLPLSEWCLTENAHKPIIPLSTFIQAQRVRLESGRNRTNQQLLDDLRSLLARKGHLSMALINADKSTVSASAYRNRFGSLRNVYRLIGYGQPDLIESNLALRHRISELRKNLIQQIRASSGERVAIVYTADRRLRFRETLILDNRIKVSVLACRYYRNRYGHMVWWVNSYKRERNLVTLIARLNETNDSFKDFHVMPKVPKKLGFDLAASDPWLKCGRPLTDFKRFCDLVIRVRKERRG